MSQAYREALTRAKAGEVAVITMPWNRPLKANPQRWVKTVTKAVCYDRGALEAWCRANRVPVGWIHESRKGVYHVDLWGAKEREILGGIGNEPHKDRVDAR